MNNQKKGFTLVELLLVIAVMALLATLTIGGVAKATKNAREKRIDSMCRSLQMSLVSFKAQEGRWPVKRDPGLNPNTINGEARNETSLNPDPYKQSMATFTGEYNWHVFQDLIPTKGTKKGYYLSPAEFLVKVRGGKTKSLREAIDDGATSNISFGYADPNNQSVFRYFKVEFNLMTDSVTVSRE